MKSYRLRIEYLIFHFSRLTEKRDCSNRNACIIVKIPVILVHFCNTM